MERNKTPHRLTQRSNTAGTAKGAGVVATVKGGAAAVGGASAGVAASAVAAAEGLAVGLGEGIFHLGKKGYNIEKDWKMLILCF